MMGKKRRSLNATIGTAANPFKCGKGSECPDKGGECRLWHPHQMQPSPDPDEKQPHRDFHEEDLECEPTMVALHGLAASIRQGADRESREAFKILIQEYRPKGCSK